MLEELVPRLLGQYQVSHKHILPAQKGYRNTSFPVELKDGRMANLILYKSEPGMEARIRRANTISNYLAAQGLSTRQTLDSRIIQLRSPSRIIYGSLYTYLPGHTIAWEAYTKDHLKLVGMVMSDMHAKLTDAPPLGNKVPDEYAAILGRMKRYFTGPLIQPAMQRKLNLTLDVKDFDKFGTVLQLAAKLPNQQVLHMDFVRSNLLFSPANSSSSNSVGDVKLSGIIDFEKTAYGHPAFDIARTLAFLLVDCRYKPEEKIRKYFLVSGYNKRGAAHFRNITIKSNAGSFDLLESLVDLYLFYDFYKFLKHNPYEFLAQNHHFLRTRDILLARNVLKCSH